MSAPTPESLPLAATSPWARLVDDASGRPRGPESGLVGTVVVRDTDLPGVRDLHVPLTVVLSGGAGQLAGPLGLAARTGLRVAAVEITLRDLDDLPGNARRVLAAADAARDQGVLDDETTLYVELPGHLGPGWLRAADELAAAELRLTLRTETADADGLAARIDAALDRETPFRCTGDLDRAVRHQDRHGFANVLLATRRAFDGADRETVVATLAERDPDVLVEALRGEELLAGARRWFTSFTSSEPERPLAELRVLGLVAEDGPR
ncbi:hypothetical protein [Nocardioides campestrisoli]|uniref:hypothetical protein n=1 Tax=Nocardioides campestrisoli TaxID=2736757 RepID=UPI0015E66487|nr:hypothetical protein [Nocardioides campestrisoli]